MACWTWLVPPPQMSAPARSRVAGRHRLGGLHLRIAGQTVQIDLPFGPPRGEMVELAALIVGQPESAIAMLLQALIEPRLQDVAGLADPEIGPRLHARHLHRIHR